MILFIAGFLCAAVPLLIAHECRARARKSEIDALSDLLKHAWIHEGYYRCGYQQMTTPEKALFDRVTDEPWSFERRSQN